MVKKSSRSNDVEKEAETTHKVSERLFDDISSFNILSNKKEVPLHTWFDFEPNSVPSKYNVEFTDVNLSDVTQKGKSEEPIHSWFKFTPAFSPALVEELIYHFDLTKQSTILDPFAGSGTTLLVAKKLGLQCYGIEINPFLVFKMEAELNWDVDLKLYKSHITDAISFTQQALVDSSTIDKKEFPFSLEKINIRNATRWWNNDIQHTLLLLKYYGIQIPNAAVKRLFLNTLACILLDVANITYGRLQLAFTDPKNYQPSDVLEKLQEKATEIVNDLSLVATKYTAGTATIIQGDSTQPSAYPNDSVDVVITSPPYVNRYSYVWNTRPYLFFFDLIDSPSKTSEIDLKSIGGTWGRATFELKDKTLEPHPELVDIIGKQIQQIRHDKQNLLMSNYVTKYFNLIYNHLTVMKPLLSDNAQLAYVIGNSAISKVYIPADEHLFDIFERLDYQPEKILRFRPRNSRKGLYEAIVFATLA